MFKNLSISAAALAAVGFAGAASAADTDSGTVEIDVTVSDIVIVDVIDPDGINVSPNGLNAVDIAGAGTANQAQRARFDVEANNNFNLTVTVPETWQASNLLPAGGPASYRQVKFENGLGDFIGGSLFVAQFPGAFNNADLWRWDGSAGNISQTGILAGSYEFELGGSFDPSLYGNASNPGGEAGALPPPGVYETTATITASIP